MQRRKFLASVGSLAAGSAAVLGTGAGNVATVKNRHAIVDVVEDKNAWLALRPADGGDPPENVFAEQVGNKLQLQFGDSGADFAGDGPNEDSMWTIPNVFGVSNTYVKPLKIWATIDNAHPKGAHLFFSSTSGGKGKRSIKANAVKVPVGWTKNFGIYFDTSRLGNYKDLKFTIHADTVDADSLTESDKDGHENSES